MQLALGTAAVVLIVLTWELARPLLRPGGRLVYFAGRRVDRDRLAAKVPVIRILEDSSLDSSGPLVIIGEQ